MTFPKTAPIAAPSTPSSRTGAPAGQWLGAAIEAGVIALVCLAPWGFAGTPPRFEAMLKLGVAGLGVLWGVRCLVERRIRWRRCAIVAWLMAMTLLAAWQLVPLPRPALRVLSPATAALYQRLLPARPEVVVAGQPETPTRPPAGSTLSLAPSLTRRELTRYACVLLLFALVRANLDPVRGLRRLSLALLINGVLLAFFGIAQVFSAEPRMVYWIYPSFSSPFGPFANRNHFAFYMNLCIGAGVGYLLSLVGDDPRSARVEGGVLKVRPVPLRAPGARTAGAVTLARPRFTLGPATLAVAFALGLMIGSVAFSLSRGGFLALLGGALFALVLWVPRLRQSSAGLVVLAVMGLGVVLVTWFGADPVTDRLATLQEGTDMDEARPAIWAQALPVIRDFPLWGLGAGAYHYIDWLNPITGRFAAPDMFTEHAHNDFLELWAEGGLSLMIPGLAVLVLIVRRGLLAARQQRDSTAGWLVLGALWAMATVVIHSLCDFGMHIPACTALVVVIAALLVGVAETTAVPAPEPRGRIERRQRSWIGRLAVAPSWVVAAAAPLLGLAIGLEVGRHERARVLRDRAANDALLVEQTRDVERIALLEAAAQLAPDSPQIASELGFAYRNHYEMRLLDLTEGPADPTALDRPPAQPWPAPAPEVLARLRQQTLVPATRSFLRSRDLAPLQAEIHLILAELVENLAEADPREVYLERAKSLAEADPMLWYRCGLVELAAGDTRSAWASWRRSLELSPQELPAILDQSVAVLGVEQTLEQVLPDDPARLLAVARRLYPRPDPGRRPFLTRALGLLEASPQPLEPDLRYLQATLYREIGQPAEALTALGQAVKANPLELRWRREHAELALAEGQPEAARDDLRVILGLQPEDVAASKLLERVNKKLAEGSR